MLQVMLVLIVVGVLLWLVTTYIPMDATIKRILFVGWSIRPFRGFTINKPSPRGESEWPN